MLMVRRLQLAVSALRGGEEVVWVGEWRAFSLRDVGFVWLWRRFACSDLGPVYVSRWDAIRFLTFVIFHISPSILFYAFEFSQVL